MAARRLIAVMLVLLFLSSLAAALAPVDRPEGEEATTTTTEATAAGGVDPGAGELLRRTIDASNGRRPPVIEGAVGDQLQLRVTADRAGTIELVGIGADEDIDPDAPAFFDVTLSRPGEIAVRFLDGGPAIATIDVAPGDARGSIPTQPG